IQFYKGNVENALDSLKPFKYRGTEEGIPNIEGIDQYSKVMVFNEDYISKYTLQKNELMENSTGIFIEDEKYKQGLEKISQQTQEAREVFQQDENISLFIDDLEKLIKGQGSSKTSLSKAGPIMKALGEGNKVAHIPESLKIYTNHIQSNHNIAWLDWQLKGEKFLEIQEGDCPYCVNEITTRTEAILQVSKNYNKKNIEHLHKLLEVFEGLMEYFSPVVQQEVKKIMHRKEGILENDKGYLLKILDEAKEIKEKLEKIKNLHFHSLKDTENVEAEIQNYIININQYSYFISDFAKQKTELINEKLRELQKKIGEFKGAINNQNQLLKASIDKYKVEINYFLQCAGYQYEVDSIEKDNKHIAILKHKNSDGAIVGKDHLSYGEKNALALILFMYQCISEKADLIILDDPISSFDQNKKFAMLNMLFNGYEGEKNGQKIKGESLRSKTILMMTHDFEPVIDLVYNKITSLQIKGKTAFFLENNNGTLLEKEITKDDIKNYTDIMQENVGDLSNVSQPAQIIYLRRFFEITKGKGLEYKLLSSLIHKREEPTINNENDAKILMNEDQTTEATESIQKYLQDFQYNTFLDLLQDDEQMIQFYHNSKSNYEKLQIYRIIFDKKDKTQNPVIKKFINETYHIENDFLFQLNPHDYQTVPQYIIDECDKDIKTLHRIEKKETEGVLD
ncbi:hypothetical protein MK079_04465, partial [Candidatus Gracilibacteria bacterium]|nr:hypothetical protein [Candidatus Gracilibacteria bacterium]